jgi:DNA adenine methylase
MEPFLKWPGGKRWLISNANIIFPEMLEADRYLEPFLGGGAVFFHLEPLNGYLSDVNQDLINSYIMVRDKWADLTDVLLKYDKRHCQEFYYQIRASKPRSPLQKAARFIYLNRTCWNGLYRVNKKGEFNVPIGTKTKVLLDSDNFQQLSFLLSQVDIEACDFERTIDKAIEGDFLFIDPPYTVKHNLNGFVKYNENIFSWDDQIRLKNAVTRAIDRGVWVLLLNADHNSIRTLYRGIGEMITLERASVIAGNSEARGIYSELAIKCW